MRNRSSPTPLADARSPAPCSSPRVRQVHEHAHAATHPCPTCARVETAATRRPRSRATAVMPRAWQPSHRGVERLARRRPAARARAPRRAAPRARAARPVGSPRDVALDPPAGGIRVARSIPAACDAPRGSPSSVWKSLLSGGAPAGPAPPRSSASRMRRSLQRVATSQPRPITQRRLAGARRATRRDTTCAQRTAPQVRARAARAARP